MVELFKLSEWKHSESFFIGFLSLLPFCLFNAMAYLLYKKWEIIMMKKTVFLLGLGFGTLVLTACQSTPQPYTGQSGYEVIEQGANTATLRYTLSGRTSQDEGKLQAACRQALGTSKNWNVSVLSSNEISNTALPDEQYGRQLGNSRTQISLSNTPDLYNTENPGARDALNARPSTLRVIQFTCS